MSDESLAEMARLLTEMSRRARLAESLVARDGQPSAPDERDGRDPDVITEYDRRIHASAARTRDELEVAQAQIVELRAKLADTEAMLKTHRERADHAMGEMDQMQQTRSQALVGRAGDASRLEQELRVFKEEYEKFVSRETHDRAREREAYQSKIDRIMRVFAGLLEGHAFTKDDVRVAFDMARDIARADKTFGIDDKATELRKLLGEVVKAWSNGAAAWNRDDLYDRAMAAIKEDS